MRRIDAIVVILLVALLATIVILSIKNDKFFNEERDLEVSKTEKQDSIVLERINGLSIKVNETMLQMDSILAAQKNYSETEMRHYEKTEQSLNHIKKVQRQLFENTK